MVLKKLVTVGLLSQFLFGKLIVGVGTFLVCPKKGGKISYQTNCSYQKRILPIQFLKKNLPNVNGISVWITRDWKENWYPAKEVNRFVKEGYTPIYIFYYFGDDISPKFVAKHQRNYFKTLRRFANYLKKVRGEKFVILNPEYNENGMEKSRQFDILQARSIMFLKSEVPNLKVGVCPGDFGDYSKIWDPINWESFRPSLTFSGAIADFIGFQEMRAVTRNRPKEILDTPYRAWGFATYLHETYQKPTFLAYLAISSYRKGGEQLQAEVYRRFAQIIPAMERGAGLIGFNIMNFIDNPNHTGYFNEAEKYWGILTTDGRRKPAFKFFRKIGEREE
ncbi:MAG: hypothetical protein ABGW77_04975 [Campylobacterales bacterium]